MRKNFLLELKSSRSSSIKENCIEILAAGKVVRNVKEQSKKERRNKLKSIINWQAKYLSKPHPSSKKKIKLRWVY